MRNIRLTLQYDGTAYQGWQRQKTSRRTLEEVLTRVIKETIGEKVRLNAASRTDAGVHARAQIVNFKTQTNIPPGNLRLALNARLPDDIRVTNVRDVPLEFHSRYHAVSKTYRYTILNRRYHDVFQQRYVYQYWLARLDIPAMRRAARLLVGKHDFFSFKRTDARQISTVRTLTRIAISRRGDFIHIDFTGQGFLYNMVRNIVGTLIEIGRGKMDVQEIRSILCARNRKAAGPTAPACGLCLVHIRHKHAAK
ncbi:MAG TPA: tRNA pseudouridine(38-40) synthase TruA [Candidatus Omnitrophota bacterium]|nr:tRNA pseudouridine(38-40) synthase TruA [Candidatus Omnitrophota bacterium]HRZ15659.1 tRNA pseudouridine(38-40) synthase TruA [Candidatus Omnitrophota bacterium]